MSAIVFLKFSKMANQPVDFNQLDKLISALVENENKHIREDEAKFRAMEQVTSYEQFQDYVKVSIQPHTENDAFIFWLPIFSFRLDSYLLEKHVTCGFRQFPFQSNPLALFSLLCGPTKANIVFCVTGSFWRAEAL